jgi:hypothetical protein
MKISRVQPLEMVQPIRASARALLEGRRRVLAAMVSRGIRCAARTAAGFSHASARVAQTRPPALRAPEPAALRAPEPAALRAPEPAALRAPEPAESAQQVDRLPTAALARAEQVTARPEPRERAVAMAGSMQAQTRVAAPAVEGRQWWMSGIFASIPPKSPSPNTPHSSPRRVRTPADNPPTAPGTPASRLAIRTGVFRRASTLRIDPTTRFDASTGATRTRSARGRVSSYAARSPAAPSRLDQRWVPGRPLAREKARGLTPTETTTLGVIA